MSSIFQALKRIFFWRYARNTWQYDVLCALILAFVFLTPARWFENGKLPVNTTHLNPTAATTRVLVDARAVAPAYRREDIEQRALALAKRPDAEVLDVRPLHDNEDRAVAFEVDIR